MRGKGKCCESSCWTRIRSAPPQSQSTARLPCLPPLGCASSRSQGGFGTGCSGVAGTTSSAVIIFARGTLLVFVAVTEPLQSGPAHAQTVTEDIAVSQDAKLDSQYGGRVSVAIGPADALGDLFGVMLGYFLIATFLAYVRDPLKGSSRPVPATSGPTSTGRVIDVSTVARAVRLEAIVLLALQLFAVSLTLGVLLPGVAWLWRGVLAVVGGGLWWLTNRLRAGRAAARGLNPGTGGRGRRRVAIMVLRLLALVLVLAGVLVVVSFVTAQTPGQFAYIAAAACLVTAGALCSRHARRLSARTAKELLSQDTRPHVLYLRSFGDDALKLRAATLGRPTLIERLSPSRFDWFEEVLTRQLGVVGPVIAINPPGTSLPRWGLPAKPSPMTPGRPRFTTGWTGRH